MPPWPAHLAALIARWRFGRRVVMDYRDNFSANHIMPGSAAAKWIEVKLDRWLTRALRRSRSHFRADGGVLPALQQPRVKVILNGYDGEIIEEVRGSLVRAENTPGSPITVRYLGRISKDRIPRALIVALSEAVRLVDDQWNACDSSFTATVSSCAPTLPKTTLTYWALFEFHSSVPYRDALRLMLTADYLLFAETSDQTSLSARGVLTTKLFEYLACGRPILAEIDEDTEAGRLIRRAGSAHVVARSKEVFAAFLSDGLTKSPVCESDATFVRTLSRESQASRLPALSRRGNLRGGQALMETTLRRLVDPANAGPVFAVLLVALLRRRDAP